MNYKKIYIIIAVVALILVLSFLYQYFSLLSNLKDNENTAIYPTVLTDQEKLDILSKNSNAFVEIDYATADPTAKTPATNASGAPITKTQIKIPTTNTPNNASSAGNSAKTANIPTTTASDAGLSYDKKQEILNSMEASAKKERSLSDEEKFMILNGTN